MILSRGWEVILVINVVRSKKKKKERKSDTELNFLFISITKTRRSLSYLATFPHGIVAFIILRVNLSAQILTEFL